MESPVSTSAYLEILSQIKLLLKNHPPVLASESDANFFRKIRSRALSQVKPLPITQPRVMQATIKATPLPQEPPVKKTAPLPSQNMIEPPKKALSPSLQFSSLISIVQKVAPELRLLYQPPNDQEAKKAAQHWKAHQQIASICVLSYHEPPEHLLFLKAIVKALDVEFRRTKLVLADPLEKEQQWDTFLSSKELTFLIVCDSTLWQLRHLMQFYKDTPPQRTCKGIPLFLLPDLSLYLKDPGLKRSLWNALCQRLS